MLVELYLSKAERRAAVPYTGITHRQRRNPSSRKRSINKLRHCTYTHSSPPHRSHTKRCFPRHCMSRR